MISLKELKERFLNIFGESSEYIVHAPGRVNLIGEHTDYSEGFVMPIAINLGITLAISKTNTKKINIYSLDYDRKIEINYNQISKTDIGWVNYPIGVINEMIVQGYDFEGVNILFTGDIPQGAGLSSSAALEIATGFAIKCLYDLDLDGVNLAKIGQLAEHHNVGVKCGIMDQFISMLGKRNKALFIDTRNLEYEYIPLKLGDVKIVITNSNVPHKLSSSKYNERVSECEEAVKIMDKSNNKNYLRDFSIQDFEIHKDELPENIRKRAFHVISENERVLKAVDALKKNNFIDFGKYMNLSHDSLRDNYEVSCPELDWLVNTARSINGVYGSRMTGAGFGGCTVTLIHEDSINEYTKKIINYEKLFGYKPEIFITEAYDGAHILNGL